MELYPYRYPGSTYTSTDGIIEFYVGTEQKVVFTPIDDEYPFEASTFGEIKYKGETYAFFVDYTDSNEMLLVSTEISQQEGTNAFYYAEIEDAFMLAKFDMKCKSKSHFFGTVIGGSLFEEGTVFEFYSDNTAP